MTIGGSIVCSRGGTELSLSGVCFRQLSSSFALCSLTSCAASGETLRHANTVIHAPPPLGMRPPPRSEILGGTSPPKSRFFKLFFQELSKFLDFFTIFKIKRPNSEEKSAFGGRWVLRTRIRPPPPVKTSFWRPCRDMTIETLHLLFPIEGIPRVLP